MKKRFRKVTAVLIAIVMTMLMIPMTAMSVNASQKDDIVSIARSQIGYKGRPNDYTRFTGSLYINGGWTTSYDWCASFVSWCANQAGVSTDVIPKHTSCTIGTFGRTAKPTEVITPQRREILFILVTVIHSIILLM